MSKKERKSALKKIKDNDVVLDWICTALGCDKKMKRREKRAIVDDMITSYADECNTDSFSVNMFGLGKKSNFMGGGYRNSDFDEDWGVQKPDNGPKHIRDIDDLIYS